MKFEYAGAVYRIRFHYLKDGVTTNCEVSIPDDPSGCVALIGSARRRKSDKYDKEIARRVALTNTLRSEDRPFPHGSVDRIQQQERNQLAMALEMNNLLGSTNIAAVGYDEQDQILGVQFWRGKGEDRSPGATYYYQNVPKEEYADMLRAESIGAFFSSHIKGQYETTKGE